MNKKSKIKFLAHLFIMERKFLGETAVDFEFVKFLIQAREKEYE